MNTTTSKEQLAHRICSELQRHIHQNTRGHEGLLNFEIFDGLEEEDETLTDLYKIVELGPFDTELEALAALFARDDIVAFDLAMSGGQYAPRIVIRR